MPRIMMGTLTSSNLESMHTSIFLIFCISRLLEPLPNTAFLVSEHQLCTVYSARGQGSGKWEKKDIAKLVVEDAGDVTTEEEQSDCYYNSDYSN